MPREPRLLEGATLERTRSQDTDAACVLVGLSWEETPVGRRSRMVRGGRTARIGAVFGLNSFA